jgi:hypothetical protein
MGGSRSRGLVSHRLELGLDLFLAHVPEVGTLLLVQVAGAVPVVVDKDDLEAEGLPEVALEVVLGVNARDPNDIYLLWRVVASLEG